MWSSFACQTSSVVFDPLGASVSARRGQKKATRSSSRAVSCAVFLLDEDGLPQSGRLCRETGSLRCLNRCSSL